MTRFKRGDKVRVVKELPEWNYWVMEMSELLGDDGEVVDLEEDYRNTTVSYAVVKFLYDDGHSERFFFPDDALELVDDPDDRVSPTMTVFDFFKEYLMRIN